MPAADHPWKIARFSVIAAARAARRRSSRSASVAPRWMSSISRLRTVNGTLISV